MKNPNELRELIFSQILERICTHVDGLPDVPSVHAHFTTLVMAHQALCNEHNLRSRSLNDQFVLDQLIAVQNMLMTIVPIWMNSGNPQEAVKAVVDECLKIIQDTIVELE